MNNQCKIDARKRGAEIMNSAPKGRQNGSRNRENINKNLGKLKHTQFNAKKLDSRGFEPMPGELWGGPFYYVLTYRQ